MSASEQYLDIDAKMLWEIASGMDDPAAIAARYGISRAIWDIIKVRPDIIHRVEQYKAELQSSGQTFKNKAKLMADQLLDRTFQSAMHEDCPLKDRVVALQLLSKLGELEPKLTTQQIGSGFSISINVPQGAITADDNVIEAAPEVPAMETPMQIDFSGVEVEDVECEQQK